MFPAKVTLHLSPQIRRASWSPRPDNPIRRALELWTLLSCDRARSLDDPLPTWIDSNWFEFGTNTRSGRAEAFSASERVAGYLSKKGEQIAVSIRFYYKGEKNPFFSQTFWIEGDGRFNPGFDERRDD